MTDRVTVQFEFSAGDLADVRIRSRAPAPALAAAARRRGLLVVIGLAGLIIFLLTPRVPRYAAITAVAIWMAILLVDLLPRTSREQKELAGYFRKRLGGDGPFRCEVEIAPEGLTIRQLGAEQHYPWASVASAVAAGRDVEIRLDRVGFVVVRGRAFAGPRAREDFLTLARRYIAAAEPPLESSIHS